MIQATTTPAKTCATCPNFDNFNEPNGRGWCNLFDYQARKHHSKTNDCVISAKALAEKELITIEFAPQIHQDENQYSYQHPKFVFGDEVEVKGSFSYPLITYRVVGLELIESKTPLGKLLSQPIWKYKVSNGEVCYHKEESALVMAGNNPIKTTPAFTTEEIEDELDQPHSQFQLGSIVKVIDKDKNHSEWATFEVIDCMYNHGLHHSTESYLNQAEWYFRLASNHDSTTISKDLWVAENELCHFEQSHLISTADIF